MDTKKHITIDDIGSRNPFGVPDRYFDSFALQMDKRLAHSLQPAKRSFLLSRWYYAAATVLVVALLAGQYFYRQHQEKLALNEQRYEYYSSQIDEPTMMEYYQNQSK